MTELSIIIIASALVGFATTAIVLYATALLRSMSSDEAYLSKHLKDQLSTVTRIKLGPDDIIVLTCPTRLRKIDFDILREHAANHWPGRKISVLEEGIKMSTAKDCNCQKAVRKDSSTKD